MTNDIYLNIAKTMPEDLERRILILLASQPHKKRLTRMQMILHIFGEKALSEAIKAKLQNSTYDRQIRLAIANLQEIGIPILSDSGRGGYFIGDREDVENYTNELVSRRDKLTQKIQYLRTADKRFVKLLQPSILGGGQ